jgi:hypothetical protein
MKPQIVRLYERDIDLLLAEELTVNPAFSGWLLGKLGESAIEVLKTFISAADVDVLICVEK